MNENYAKLSAAIHNSGTKTGSKPLLSRATADIINSLSWFFMDAFWMLQFPKICVCCILPTALSGIGLLLTNGKNRPLMLMDISTNCWIWMNFFWILQDMWGLEFMMPYVKILTLVGIACLIAAVKTSNDIKALFKHFGPFRRHEGSLSYTGGQTADTLRITTRKPSKCAKCSANAERKVSKSAKAKK